MNTGCRDESERVISHLSTQGSEPGSFHRNLERFAGRGKVRAAWNRLKTEQCLLCLGRGWDGPIAGRADASLTRQCNLKALPGIWPLSSELS